MDWQLMAVGAIATLSLFGALSLMDMAGEFHRRGLERVRKGSK